jgi:imidazolonepropionase-like amidohydrolase
LTAPNPLVPLSAARKRPEVRALLLLGALAVGLTCRPTQAPVTLRAGLLLDGRGGQQRDVLITVMDGRIATVEPWDPSKAPVTHDLSRYTVLPGLIDAHVHISGYFNHLGKIAMGRDGETAAEQTAGRAAVALATLRGGFTTVASMGAWSDRALRDAINDDSIPGPRILTSFDPIVDTSLSLTELKRALRHRKATGADFVKIFESTSVKSGGAPTFNAEKLELLCGAARRLGLRSVVHAQSDASLKAAVEAGCDQVEHGFLATAEGIKLVAEHGIFFDPQCSLLLHNYLDNWDRFKGVRGFDSAGFAFNTQILPLLPKVTRLAFATSGLKVLYGTDATAGAHGRNAEDLVCWVREAGVAPMDALVAATSRNALALGLGEEIGSVAPGYRADLIALDGNPLEAIEAVRRVVFVMKGGRVYRAP